MAAIIYQIDDKGRVIGRCDARCYNAITTQCDCICGGVNHGIGYRLALAETKLRMEEFSKREDVKLSEKVTQGDLF